MAIVRNGPSAPRRIRDPDSESDEDDSATVVSSLPPKATDNANMEFFESHAPRQQPRKNVEPKRRAEAKRNNVVDLTADSPVRPKARGPLSDSSSQSSNLSGHEVPRGSQGLDQSTSSQKSTMAMPDIASLDFFDRPIGSSIAKRPGGSSKPKNAFAGHIKPATPNAFGSTPGSSSHRNPFKATSSSNNSWPVWVTQNTAPPIGSWSTSQTSFQPKPKKKAVEDEPAEDEDVVEREEFNINVRETAEDYEQHHGDAEAHMRELLSGAVGSGEQDEAFEEGDDVIEGFAKGMRLMPHQVRGTKWMKQRETGRKYGGILADDMGLGKTVQTLARIVDGMPTAAEKRAGFKGGSLIVAPLAVMEQWATEASTKTVPGRLKVTTHHGPSRTKSGKTLEKFDLVITTFQTLASEFKAYEDSNKVNVSDEDSDSDSIGKKTLKKKGKKASHALFDLKWLRVVIDEAQNIKNRKTNAAKAATALRAKYRWCLTGTPIQNNVEELFSLFHFLRARPLDRWELFNERIVKPMKRNQTKLAMKRLHAVLPAIMLRRTKDAEIDGKPILSLPGRKVDVISCAFDAEEREFYTALEQKTALTFNKFLKAGTVMNNYTSVLTMLLRLRQACDHPSLVAGSLSVDAEAIDNSEAQAGVEVDKADALAVLMGNMRVENAKKCEMCFAPLDPGREKHCADCAEISQKAAVKAEDGMPDSSSKIRKLLELLNDVEERSGKKEKTIVFSQFTSFLNLIEPFLKAKGIKFVRYDGAMRNDKRQESLEKIKTDPSIRVILISFKAGSTGLNLTCCNNVVLMDLWWNPALEDQAFDRAHRLGQKLDVNIYKLTIEETVENRILALQDAKRNLAKAALSGDAKGVMKLSLSDIIALFKTDQGHGHDGDGDGD